VKNVHIRFEQGSNQSSRIVAFGITLESLNAQSCDSDWKPLTSSYLSTTDFSYKTVVLNKLGVYCDTKTEKHSHVDFKELKV